MTLFLTALAVSAITLIATCVFLMACYIVKRLLETLLDIILEACFAVSELTVGSVFRVLVQAGCIILLLAVIMWICCTVPDLIKV